MDDHDCNRHQCKHCKKLISLPWKDNGELTSRPTKGLGAHHTARVQRRLENYCNEQGRSFIAERANEEDKMKKT